MCSKGIIWATRMTIMGLTLTLFAIQGTSANAAAPYFKVHGLPPGAVLWVRSGPGPQFKRIGFFPATARHIRSYGCRKFVRGTWCRVEYRGGLGWAPQRLLSKDNGRRA